VGGERLGFFVFFSLGGEVVCRGKKNPPVYLAFEEGVVSRLLRGEEETVVRWHSSGRLPPAEKGRTESRRAGHKKSRTRAVGGKEKNRRPGRGKGEGTGVTPIPL